MTEAEAEAPPVDMEGMEGEGEERPPEDGAELADDDGAENEEEEGEEGMPADEEYAGTPEPEVEEEEEEEPFVPGPLVVSEAHENFTLDKKMEDDPTIGLPNPRHIICQFCEVILIPDGNAIKCSKEVNLI